MGGHDCTSLGCGSPKQSLAGDKVNPIQGNPTSINVVCDEDPEVGGDKTYRTRFVYNSQVIPADIEAEIKCEERMHGGAEVPGEMCQVGDSPRPPSVNVTCTKKTHN